VAVKGDETYVKVEYKDELLILAKPRLEAVFSELLKAKPEDYRVVEEFDGSTLEGIAYEPLLDTPSQQKLDAAKSRKVILSVKVMTNKKYKKKMAKEDTRTEEEKAADAKYAASKKTESPSKPAEAVEEYEDFVTMADGTGLVHCAPGCGQSDYFMGKHYGLAAISPVDVHGKFTADGGIWAGVYVKKADAEIMKHIEEKGLMLNADYKMHRTTLCWRCKTPLIFRLSRQWYLKVDPLKEKMLSENEQVKWYPEFGQIKFANWLSDREDWCISQQRYWGIPMPIWECKKCNAKLVIGSRDELLQNAVKKPDDLSDLHRHTVDPIKLKCSCGGEMERIHDIFNVWFDSGIAPWASLGYPFKNKVLFEKVFPVDLVVESQDQIRGWFDSLMFASVGVFGHAPYKQVGLMGWVLDEKGEKMSKSLGNVVSATDAITKLGADALRFYYCWEVPPWEVQKFSFKSAGEIQRFLSILYNSYVFFETYLPTGFKPDAMTEEYYKSLPAEDRFIVSAVNNLAEKVTIHLEAFEFQHAGRELLTFTVDKYSRWYVKLIRDRASGADEKSKKQAFSTVYYVLSKLTKLLAPLTPFIAERIYQNLKRFDANEKCASLHFAEYPTKDAKLVDDLLEEQMLFAMQLTETANSMRQEAKIKLRWPVARIVISGDEKAKQAAYALGLTISSSTNAMEVSFAEEKPDGSKWLCREFAKGATLYLDFEMTPKLSMLAATRELTRAIQAARKAESYVVADRIELVLNCSDHSFERYIIEHEKDISIEVGAKSISFGRVEKASAETDLSELSLGTVKASFTKA
ncbi:MAG: class I tRNA ligase family protein, partial [Candidatus Micrarchaeia archaeon]